MNPWPEILAMFLRNAFLELGPTIWHARPALREAADVLRTYRRAARWERKAQVNAKMGFVQQFMQYVDASIECSKIEPREVRNRALRGPKSSPEGSKIEPRGLQDIFLLRHLI